MEQDKTQQLEEENFFEDTAGEEEDLFPSVVPVADSKQTDPDRFTMLATLAGKNTGRDTTFQSMSDFLSKNGEAQVREMASHERALSQLNALKEEFKLGISDADIERIKEIPFAMAALSEDTGSDTFAVEKGAVDYAAKLTESLNEEDIKITKNILILQSILEREYGGYQDQGFGSKAAGMFMSLLTPNNMINDALLNVPGFKGNAKFWQANQGFLEKRSTLLGLSTEEFEQVIEAYVQSLKFHHEQAANITGLGMAGKSWGQADIVYQLSRLATASETDNGPYNFWQLFGLASGGLDTAIVFNALRSPVRALIAVNREAGIDAVAESVWKFAEGTVTPGVKSSDVLDSLLPSSLSTNPGKDIGVSADVAKEIEARRFAIQKTLVANHAAGGRIDEEDLVKLAADARAQALYTYETDLVKDVKLAERDPVTGVYKMDVFLGKANEAGGYADASVANQAAIDRGLKGYTISFNSDGQFYIKVRANVGEEGLASFGEASELSGKTFGNYRNPLSWIPEQLRRLQLHAGFREDKLTALGRELVKPFNALKGNQLNNLSVVLARGRTEEKWFSETELATEYQRAFNRTPTKKETSAYYAYRDVSDMDHAIRDIEQTKNLQRAGIKDLEVASVDLKAQGTLVEKIDDGILDSPIFDTQTKTLKLHGSFTNESLKARLDNGWSLVVLRDSTTLDSSEPFRYLLAKKNEIKVNELGFGQVGYIPGGHILYRDNLFFGKQNRTGAYSNGRSWRDSPIAHFATGSQLKGEAYVARWNTAVQVIKDYRAGTVNEIALKNTLEGIGVRNLDAWDAMVAEGRVSENDPFVLVRDGEGIPASTGAFTDLESAGSFVNDTEKYFFARNKKYTGKRGPERLHGPEDDEIPLLDPLVTMERALGNAIRTNAYGDYKIIATEGWNKIAAPYMQNIKGRSLTDNLSNPLYKDRPTAEEAKTINELENARHNILRQMGAKTWEEKKADVFRANMARWVEGKTGIEASTTLTVTDVNPVQAIKAFGYNVFLGLGNVKQFFRNTTTAMGAVAVHPVRGAEALRMYPAMRVALLKGGEEGILEVAKGLPKEKQADFISMMKEFDDSGFFNLGGGRLQLGVGNDFAVGAPKYLTKAGVNTWVASKRLVNKLLEAGKIPFNEGDMVNRLVAANMSWQDFKATFPGKSTTDKFARGWMIDKASLYSGDMSKAAKTRLSEGLAGMFTQFWHYPMHVLENSYGPFSRYTKQEQKRYAIGQIVLFGSAAIPGGRWALDQVVEEYESATGTKANDSLYHGLTTGVLDGIIYAATDGEMDPAIGAWAGGGAFMEQTISPLLTEKSLLESFQGASLPVLQGFTGKVWRNLQILSQLHNTDGITQEDLLTSVKDIAREAGSWDSFEKMRLMLKTQMAVSKTGVTQFATSDLDAIGSLLGVPMRGTYEPNTLYDILSTEKASVKKDAKLISEWINRASLADSDAEADAYIKRAAAWRSLFNDPRHDGLVMDEVRKSTDGDTWLNLARRVEDAKGTVPAVQSLYNKQERRRQNEKERK